MSSFVVFFLVLLASLGSSRGQNCDGGTGGFVGFTALTPDQLKKTIEENVESSILHTLSPAIEALLSLNDSLDALTEQVSKMEKAVESTVQSAVMISLMAGLERSFQLALNEAVANLTRVFEKQIYGLNSSSPSGLYWVSGGAGPPSQVYCDMDRTCGGVVGGWTRIANIDMTNAVHSCPSNLVEVSLDVKPPRLCTLARDFVGCSSTMFSTYGIGYDRVCGRVIGYQDRTPNAFFPYHVDRSLTIDDTYLDGVSLTHGLQPRQHIWSFVAALDESDDHQSGCPCLNIESTTQAAIPPFVGDDYFCDTGSMDDVKNVFYPDNPLWDGDGCGEQNECCSFNNPPWFSKALGRSVSDDIEMRVCRDAGHLNEDVPLELIEIYIR